MEIRCNHPGRQASKIEHLCRTRIKPSRLGRTPAPQLVGSKLMEKSEINGEKFAWRTSAPAAHRIMMRSSRAARSTSCASAALGRSITGSAAFERPR